MIEDDFKLGFCSSHSGAAIEFYCRTCTVDTCRECNLQEHNGHETIALSAEVNLSSMDNKKDVKF